MFLFLDDVIYEDCLDEMEEEDIDSTEPMTTIYYEVKPINERISPYVRAVKSVSRDGSSRLIHSADDNSVLKCDCGKLYRTEASLRFHKYECGRLPSFQCPYCTYVGKRNTTLKKHIKARHDNRIHNM